MMRQVLIALALLLLAAPVCLATPEYSERSGQGCRVCHVEPGGGALSPDGLRFAASGYVWPPTGGYRVMGPIREGVRLLIGFLHIVAGFIWFGAILYVHLLLRPGYALKGLPRGEVMTGLASMAVVGVTGVLLTVSRVRGVEVLFSSPWGLLLSAKMALYLVMVGTAGVAVTVVGPRLRRGRVRAVPPGDGVFGPETLSAFDGADGRPSYVAHGGTVYDVGGLRLWKGGAHMKHRAGTDLTAALDRAPHGVEKLADLPRAGTFDASRKAPLTLVQRLFYVIAYLNLGLVFAVLLVIAWWRWGI
jgi:predicted heme/steroid binding protein